MTLLTFMACLTLFGRALSMTLPQPVPVIHSVTIEGSPA